MKKILAIAMTLMLLLASCAFAAEIKPLESVDMAGDLNDCMLHVGFKLDALSEDALIADIYDEMRYDVVDVLEMKVGDTISYLGEDYTVESIEEDYCILINGGSEEGGITLLGDEGGTYIALDYETTAYLMVGQAEFPLADEVVFSYWQEDDDGGIMDDLATETVAKADLKSAMTARFDYADSFYASECVITVEGGVITEVTINYVP